jgi:hypothetical protein
LLAGGTAREHSFENSSILVTASASETVSCPEEEIASAYGLAMTFSFSLPSRQGLFDISENPKGFENPSGLGTTLS